MTPLQEVLVTRTFNTAMAGRRASPAMVEVLLGDWLPALGFALEKSGVEGACWLQTRRLLVRFGWLLQRLPITAPGQADAVRTAMREFRTSLHECAPTLFPDPARRANVLAVMGNELQAASQDADGRRHALPQIAALGMPVPPVPTKSMTSMMPTKPPVPTLQPASLSLAERAARSRNGALPAEWEGVINASRENKRLEDEALAAMTRIAALRAGDRLALRTRSGVEVWRVMRAEPTRRNIQVQSEDRESHGVMNLAMLARQLSEGSLTILS